MNEGLRIRNSLGHSFDLSQLIPFCDENDIIVGDKDIQFDNIADAINVNSSSLDWVHRNNKEPWSYFLKSKARVVILPKEYLEKKHEIPEGKAAIFSTNPMLLFLRIARELFTVKPEPGIHPSAVVHSEAIIGKDVYIGPICYIGKCEIGDDCIIHSHVSIEDNVTIGNNVLIKNGARIGQPGFGFVKNENGEYEKFPQVGRVIIENNVEIGANTCIDRGSLSATRIGRGTKIDDFVHVAHNVSVGKNCIITGSASFGGSSFIGDDVWIGPGANIKDGITIGNKAFISIGSVVIKNVKDGEDVIGYPAENKAIFVGKRVKMQKIYMNRR